MPDRGLPLSWRRAALDVERRLRQLTGQAPTRLNSLEVASCYPTRNWVAGWRVNVCFTDGITRRVDVVATRHFPRVPIRTALVDHPEFLSWPHVESDGILCLLPNMHEVDPDDPAGVAEDLFRRSVQLIEELLEGSIVERDFKEEFITYWAYKPTGDGAPLVSLIRPEPPSRLIQVWRGEGIQVVADDRDALLKWLRRRFGRKVSTVIRPGAFIWLDTPPLPSQYPETGADLRALAKDAGEDATAALEAAATDKVDEVLAILGAPGRGGVGLISVKALNPKVSRPRLGAASEPLSKGFRPTHTPASLVQARLFGQAPVARGLVARADPQWVHGRGQDARTDRLLGSRVVLFGCGSVGGPVACALVQAGVGQVVLCDSDELSWPNVGRHPLGATAVGQNKAEALAARLQRDFPHLQIKGRPLSVQQVLVHDAELLERADLIISATGSWAADSALNRWHLAEGRRQPVLYGWTEAHAVAGHAVAIGPEGGCLQCHIGRTGSPDFEAVAWPDGGDAGHEEPACGAHFQPYGPVELGYVTAMIGEAALDCLLDPPRRSFARVFVTSGRRLAQLGGQRTEQWLAEQGTSDEGRTVDRDWSALGCAACEGELAERVA